jgi:hypothetical protein
MCPSNRSPSAVSPCLDERARPPRWHTKRSSPRPRPPLVCMGKGKKRPADADAGTPQQPRGSCNEKEDRRAALLHTLPPLFRALRATQGGGAVKSHPRLVVGVTAVMRTLQNTERAVTSVLIATKARVRVCPAGCLVAPSASPHVRWSYFRRESFRRRKSACCKSCVVREGRGRAVAMRTSWQVLTRAALGGHLQRRKGCMASPWTSPAKVCMPTDFRLPPASQHGTCSLPLTLL